MLNKILPAVKTVIDLFAAKLPAEQHAPVARAILTLRRVRQARNAAQQGVAEGGLTERLAALGITDAPPNWAAAWDIIRAATVDALTVIRHELRRWIDSPGA